MSGSGYSRLRVEDTPPSPAPQPKKVPDVVVVNDPPSPKQADPDHWRKLAMQATNRLEIAEAQARDLRAAADEARARFSKYKGRLESAQARVNELQVQVVRVTAERDDARSQLARQEAIARKVHEYRQSLLDGPIWDLFTELAVVSPPIPAGGERA